MQPHHFRGRALSLRHDLQHDGADMGVDLLEDSVGDPVDALHLLDDQLRVTVDVDVGLLEDAGFLHAGQQGVHGGGFRHVVGGAQLPLQQAVDVKPSVFQQGEQLLHLFGNGGPIGTPENVLLLVGDVIHHEGAVGLRMGLAVVGAASVNEGDVVAVLVGGHKRSFVPSSKCKQRGSSRVRFH